MNPADVDPQSQPHKQTLIERPDPDRPATGAATETELETETPGGSLAAGHDPYAALRFRGYWLYTVGWVFSVIGQQVQSVAVGWEITHRLHTDPKHASLALGIVGGVQALPVMLLSIPAGHLADVFDRRRIVMISVLMGAVFSAGLALVSHVQGSILWMYVLLGLNATALAVGWPARSALLPQIVPAEVFSNAATWNSSAFQIAAVAGPALGGLVVNFTTAGAYVIDAACGVTFFLFLLMLRVRSSAPRTKEPATLSSLAAGIRFVWRTKIILATITLDLFAVLFGGATALLPVYATQILHVGAVGFGWLKAAPAIGAFVTALLIAHLPPMKRAGRAMLLAVAGFGVATIVFGVSRWYWLSLLAFALTGSFDNISVVVRHTLVQVLPPDSMRGRVSAVNNVFIGASNQLGELESGLAGWLLGPILSVVTGGIGTLLVVAGVALAWPQVRRFGSLRDARPMEVEEDAAAGEFPVTSQPATGAEGAGA
jgi:MFS family permease